MYSSPMGRVWVTVRSFQVRDSQVNQVMMIGAKIEETPERIHASVLLNICGRLLVRKSDSFGLMYST